MFDPWALLLEATIQDLRPEYAALLDEAKKYGAKHVDSSLNVGALSVDDVRKFSSELFTVLLKHTEGSYYALVSQVSTRTNQYKGLEAWRAIAYHKYPKCAALAAKIKYECLRQDRARDASALKEAITVLTLK